MGPKLRKWLVGPALVFVLAMAGTMTWAAGPASAMDRGKHHHHHRPPPYGPSPCPVTVSPPTVGHGGTITVRLSGQCFNDTFNIIVKNRTLGSITTDAAGNGSGTFALPCGVNVGTHTLFAVDGKGNTASTTFTVTHAPCASAPGHEKGGQPPPKHKPHRPGTGSDVRVAGVSATAAMPAGAAAVGLAGLLILRARKRRRNHFTA